MTNETKTIDIRRFTEVDWYGLSGCRRFEDGSQPFIAHCDLIDSQTGRKMLCQLVADREGFYIMGFPLDDDGSPEEDVEYHLTFDPKGGNNPTFAEIFLRGILVTHNNLLYTYSIEQLGFKRI